jgi:hypothetical protein
MVIGQHKTILHKYKNVDNLYFALPIRDLLMKNGNRSAF